MTLLESSSISNCQKAFVHQTKTDNKQLGGTCNLTKNFPYPIPPIIVHNPDDEINEINKLAMIHQEQGDINAGYTKPPSTNITTIDNPDHNCQANTASNPVIYKQKVDSQCELKSYPNSNASNSKANEFKKKNQSDVNELKQTTLDNKIEHEQSLAKLRETNQNETPNDDILMNENPRECYTSEERNLDSVQYVSQRCYYVNGKIGHVRLNFLIDTGSSISVISEKTFGKICQDSTVLYDTDRKVHTANGSLLKLKGACTLQMQLDHIIFSQEFIVANIAEPGILGMSFLDQVEADINFTKKTLKTNKGKITLNRDGHQEERLNRTPSSMTSALIDENRRHRDDHLPYLMENYKSTYNTFPDLSPNNMVLSHKTNELFDCMVGPDPGGGLTNTSSQAFKFAHKQLGPAAASQKNNYETGLKPHEFEKGNWVWKWYPPSKPFINENHPKSWLNEDMPHEAYDSSDSEDDHYENSGIQTPDDPPDPMVTQTTPTVQKTKSGRTIKPRKIYSPE